MSKFSKFAFLCLVTLLNISCDKSVILQPVLPVNPSPVDQYSLDAQILAARMSETPWIDSITTAEIESALSLARSVHPELAAIHCHPDFVLTQLIVEPTQQVAQRWAEGSLLVGDKFLDSLAVLYHLTSVSNGGYNFFVLNFQHSLNIPKLAQVFAQSSNIIYAEPNGFVGDGDRISALKKSGTWDFVFSHGEGDCPAGCIWRNFFYVTVSPSSIPTYIQERETPLPPEIYLWNIPPIFIATVYSSAQDLLDNYQNNKWWVRQHAVEVTWRFFVYTAPWSPADDNLKRSQWNIMQTQLQGRKAEVIIVITQRLQDADPDVRASAQLALSKISR